MNTITGNMFERIYFSQRKLFLTFFLIVSIVLGYFAIHLKQDASFTKWFPLKHEYMITCMKYMKEFGGGNQILVALVTNKKDIYYPDFFNALKAVTEDLFFIPGVERSSVKSLFTPNVRFIEVVEGGFSGGNIINSGFKPTPEALEQVNKNVQKSNYIGRLVSEDFTGALISLELQEKNPKTGEKLNYADVAQQLEQIRKKYETKDITVAVIGFTKLVGDVLEGVKEVIVFFLITFIITAIFLYIFSCSFYLTIVPLACSLVALVWQLGVLNLLGYGLDPMSVLVPFLIFAIGVSHGVQMINAMKQDVMRGYDSLTSAHYTFNRMLLPGGVALLSDSIGFLMCAFIEVEVIREMAVTASIGIAALIITNLFVLPLLLSFVPIKKQCELKMEPVWEKLCTFTHVKKAKITILFCIVLFIAGAWKANDLKVGDLKAGVPELKEDSRLNQDIALITKKFSIGVDVLSVISETPPDSCVDYEIMKAIDNFAWHMQNVEGVKSVIALTTAAKAMNAAWNEGNLKWHTLPSNKFSLGQAVSPIHVSSGLLDFKCGKMPVLIFPKDHKGETIERIITAIKTYKKSNKNEKINFNLASGNVGFMAATNETVKAAQLPMLCYIYAVTFLLCLVTFRSFKSTLCIILPLALVSALTYAFMTTLDIGLKAATLPVATLGVGIGVDYGIYIFNNLQKCFHKGMGLQKAYHVTLRETGSAVLFTGLTLAVGVSTWIFSDLQFQADMGALLTFMFLVNMLGAVFLLPAIATLLFGGKK
ncbi:MAG: RND family transporter [Nitrospinae bacterium]|nr:RND family transporter [Nitrospinota bacterium]